MDRTVFLIGFVIMSVSSLALYAKGSKAPAIRHHTYFHASVPFIAATAYLAMYLGIGAVTTSDGVTTLTARYADWSVTTPILLAGLVMAGLHERGRPAGFLVAIIVLDVLMIVAGLIASLTVPPAAKLAWFLWSCAAFAGVLYILWVPVRQISWAEGGAMASAFQKNVTFLSVIWFIYPIVFALAPEGLRIITAAGSAWAILVLDVTAKVIYGFIAAANIEKATHETSADER